MTIPQATVDLDDGGFRVTFDYVPELVAWMKTIPGAKWRRSDLCWIVPGTTQAVTILLRTARMDGAAIARATEIANRAKLLAQLSSGRDWKEDFVVPRGQALMPFQRAGVAYAVAAKRAIIGDQMGLGKTVEALVTLKQLEAFPALIVAKRTAVPHWMRLAARWIPGIPTREGMDGSHINIVTWSALSAFGGLVKSATAAEKEGDVTAWRQVPMTNYQGFVLDESHMAKEPKSARTIGAKYLARSARVKLLLSGTVFLNRPRELIAQLEILDRLEEFGGWWYFTHRYCQATKTRYGLHYDGASNLEELGALMRSTCYVRREKKGPNGVLDQLPEKRRETVYVPLTPMQLVEYRKAEQNFLSWLATHVGFEAVRSARKAEELVRINALRRLVAELKTTFVVDWIQDFLESTTDEKLVVFAHHLDVIKKIAGYFQQECVTLTGEMNTAERERALQCFEVPQGHRLLVASMLTGGESIDLTAASNVAFVELGWNRPQHEQAEDRLHRIGQKGSVVAHYLIARDTIDEWMLELIQSKETIGRGIEGDLLVRYETAALGGGVNVQAIT